MRYGLAIDLKRCMGCQTCMTSCRTANNLPTGNWWNRVITDGGESLDSPDGEYPNCTLQHYPVTCQHCENAPCVEVCPTGATMKDEETGIVTVDAETCIGCKTCMQACPYEVRVYNDGEPKYAMEFAVGFADAPQHVSNTVEKCTMCSNLIARGEKPMCVQACVGYARFFGDLDDPNSEVSKLIAEREWEQLLPEQGTNPSVYYLK